jgi:hypothetical protein
MVARLFSWYPTSIFTSVSASTGAVVAVFILFPHALSGQQRGKVLAPKDSTRSTVLEKKERFTPQQIITADTTRRASDSTSIGTTTPGEYPFTPEQDRAFYDALQMPVTPLARFQYELKRFSPAWMEFLLRIRPQDDLQAARESLERVPRSAFEPSGRERTAYDYGIAQAFTVPGIYEPFKRSGGIGKNGLVTFDYTDVIDFLLGRYEDVSPVVSYAVEDAAEVDVVVYSIQAIAVARLFRGQQMVGSYSLTWDLKDFQGRRVPRGDYVAEVKIGTGGIVRKRIKVK